MKMINFWEESFWLPSNTSWKDIENGKDKAVVYGSVQDLWVQVPMVVIIFALRHFCEKISCCLEDSDPYEWLFRNLFKPFGKYLQINDDQRRKAPENSVLEAHYKKSTRLKDLSQIAKKVDMSERQVERWWRLRRSQDKPSTLVKFTENLWKGSFYLCNECYAVSVLWSKGWVWNVDLCFEGYPHQGITDDVKWYYMISSAFYWSLTISHFYDVRRKDFLLMFVHHVTTIILITFSWISNLHRLGSIILVLHDCSDIFLEFAKAAKYARNETLVNIIFGMFVFVWTSMRLYCFPFVLFRTLEVIHKHTRFNFPMFISLYVLLCALMVLNVVWTLMIFKLLFRVLFHGEAADDVRSSCSETTDDESSKEHINNKLKTN